MRRSAEQFRRIKWRDVTAEEIMSALKCRPGGVNNESRQSEKDDQRLQPPDIGAHCFAERIFSRNRCRGRSIHWPSAPSTGSFAFFHASQLPGTFQRLSKPFSFKMLAAILAR